MFRRLDAIVQAAARTNLLSQPSRRRAKAVASTEHESIAPRPHDSCYEKIAARKGEQKALSHRLQLIVTERRSKACRLTMIIAFLNFDGTQD